MNNVQFFCIENSFHLRENVRSFVKKHFFDNCCVIVLPPCTTPPAFIFSTDALKLLYNLNHYDDKPLSSVAINACVNDSGTSNLGGTCNLLISLCSIIIFPMNNNVQLNNNNKIMAL